MKKLVTGVLAAVLVLMLGTAAVLGVAYFTTGEDTVPQVRLLAAGSEVAPARYEWNQPVLGGVLYKGFSAQAGEGTVQLGTRDEPFVPLAFPEGYDAALTLLRGAEVVYTGPAAGWEELLLENGDYLLTVQCTTHTAAGSGSFDFSLAFSIDVPPEPEPVFLAGRLQLAQGDILALRLENLPEEVTPTGETGLGMAVFTPLGGGAWRAAVPVGNTCEVGSYAVRVQAGELAWEVTVEVLPFEFKVQNLIIDHSAPNITEANSPEAYQQYNAKVPPLWDEAEAETYWEGLFIWPVEGRVSTEFGQIRYTNGDWSTARSHWGMDIAADADTPVVAPNHGRVVFAEYLLNTGNTLAIEHGGGLRSYYYHMNALNVEVGDMVQKGDVVGLVGSTGYSTGPHLHFEMRIGRQAVSPTMLFEADAGLYSLEGWEEGQP